MNLENLSITELLKLEKDLMALEKDMRDNRLDYMEWHRYPEQDDMRKAILDRFETKKGPHIFITFGGNRSGKSELGAGVVSEIFGKYPNKRIWAATLSDISIKAQQRKLDSLIRKRDISYGEYNEVRGWKNKTIISKKRTVLYFKTYEQGAASFQGDDIDVAWFDEECPYDVFSETCIRLGDREGIFVLTFTSLMGFTRLVKELWESGKPYIKTTVLTPDLNPFLTDKQKAQLFEIMDPDEVESRRHGKPHIKSGLVYKEYSTLTHRIDRFDYTGLVKNNPNRWELSEGIDPHERKPHYWLRFLYDRSENILYVVEEIKAPYESMVIEDFARLIKQKRNKLNPRYCQIDTSAMKPDIIVRPDDEDQLNAHNVKSEFAKHGIPCVLVTKDNALGINEVKKRMKVVRTTGENGEIKVKRKPTIYFFKDLVECHEQFTKYQWDSYESAKIAERNDMVNKPRKKDDDFPDIVKYECIRRKSSENFNKNIK